MLRQRFFSKFVLSACLTAMTIYISACSDVKFSTIEGFSKSSCNFLGVDVPVGTFYGYNKLISNNCKAEQVELTCGANQEITPASGGLYPFCVTESCEYEKQGDNFKYVKYTSYPEDGGDPSLPTQPPMIKSSEIGLASDSRCRDINLSDLGWPTTKSNPMSVFAPCICEKSAASCNPGEEFVEAAGSEPARCVKCELLNPPQVAVSSTSPGCGFAVGTSVIPTDAGGVTCTPNPVPFGQNTICVASSFKTNFSFSKWILPANISCSSPQSSSTPANECVLSKVQIPQTIQAEFSDTTRGDDPAKKWTIQGSANPASGGSVVCSPTSVAGGKSASCTATEISPYSFVEWDDKTCSNPSSPICAWSQVNGDKNVQAKFAIFRLNVSALGTGSGQIKSLNNGGTPDDLIRCGGATGPCNQLYPKGTVVTLTAQPAQDSSFVSWVGCDPVAGSNPPKCTVKIDGDNKVSAVFSTSSSGSNDLSLVIVATGDGSGTLVSDESTPKLSCALSPTNNSCSTTYKKDDSVTLKVPANLMPAHSTFGGWNNFKNCSASSQSCTFQMADTSVVTVSFQKKTYPITVNQTTGGTITCDAASVVYDGTVNCTANPAAATLQTNYTFSGWTGPCASFGTALRCTLNNITEPKTVSGGFTATAITTAPDAPTNVMASAGDRQITITFAPPTNTGGSGVTISSYSANCNGISVNSSSTSITINNLSNGTSYACYVTATNSVNKTSVQALASPNPVIPTQALPNTYTITGSGTVTLDTGSQISSSSTVGGTVVCSPSSVNRGQQTTCTATAASYGGQTFEFQSWSAGPCASSGNPCTFTPSGTSASIAVAASFGCATPAVQNAIAADSGSAWGGVAPTTNVFTVDSNPPKVALFVGKQSGATYSLSWSSVSYRSSFTGGTASLTGGGTVATTNFTTPFCGGTVTANQTGPASHTLTVVSPTDGNSVVDVGQPSPSLDGQKIACNYQSRNDCAETISVGTSLTLKANLAQGYSNIGWVGCVQNLSYPEQCTFSATTSGSTQVVPTFSGLWYAPAVYTFTANTAIQPITASRLGGVSSNPGTGSCGVMPALPSGLSLSIDCNITGTPTVAKPVTDYTVTLTRNGVTVARTIQITVNPEATPPTGDDCETSWGSSMGDLGPRYNCLEFGGK